MEKVSWWQPWQSGLHYWWEASLRHPFIYLFIFSNCFILGCQKTWRKSTQTTDPGALAVRSGNATRCAMMLPSLRDCTKGWKKKRWWLLANSFTSLLSKLPHDPSPGISKLCLYRRSLGCLSDRSVVNPRPVVKLLFELIVHKCGACLCCVVSICLLQRNDLQGKCSQASNGVLQSVFCDCRPKTFTVCLLLKYWGRIWDEKAFWGELVLPFSVEWINKHLEFRHQWESIVVYVKTLHLIN